MPATDGPTAPDADEEDWVIARLSADRTAPPTVAVGIGDDAALFADGRVVTVDTMVEGVHWDDKLSPGDVGWKLVAVNVSDVGAMGGRPEWALLAMSLPSPLDRLWVNAFAEGLHAACAHWGVALIGGDTSRGPARSLSLTVGGHAGGCDGRGGGGAFVGEGGGHGEQGTQGAPLVGERPLRAAARGARAKWEKRARGHSPPLARRSPGRASSLPMRLIATSCILATDRTASRSSWAAQNSNS